MPATAFSAGSSCGCVCRWRGATSTCARRAQHGILQHGMCGIRAPVHGMGMGMGMGMVCACACAWARRSTRSYAARGGAPWTSITIPRAVAAAAASSRSSASALTQSMRRGLCASKSATSAALQPSKSTLARLLRPTSWDRLPASSHEAAAESASVSIHTSDVPCGDAEVRWVERKGYPKSV